MNQNENKPLTAEEILDNLYRYVNKDINDDAAWDIAMQQIEQYAAQHVKGKEAEWITSARLAVNEGVAHYAQQVKQVTEERDKPIRLLDRVYELLADGYTIDQSYPIADHIKEFLNSLNAAMPLSAHAKRIMGVSMNGIRNSLASSFNSLVNTLHANQQDGDITITPEDIQAEMDDIRQCIGTLHCCFMNDVELFDNMSDDCGKIKWFNPENAAKEGGE